jgi:ribonucleoside-diphosphate reductase beta chain
MWESILFSLGLVVLFVLPDYVLSVNKSTQNTAPNAPSNAKEPILAKAAPNAPGDAKEPILTEADTRFCIFPIQHHDIWEFYKNHVAGFWTVGEIDLSVDQLQWRDMPDPEKHFIKVILAFFATADGIVSENLALNFIGEVQYAEARAFWAFQNAMENIHNETYSVLIDTFIQDQSERLSLFRGVSTMPCIHKKSKWALQWMSRERPFCQRLVAFSCVEGIFFSGSFCAIFWLKTKGILPGLTFSNELISRDETLHTLFACHVYKHHILNKLDEETIHNMVRGAVEIEEDFIRYALPNNLIGMNSDLMIAYIRFVADYLLVLLGYSKLWNIPTCPFPFMEMMSLQGKTNFFEKRVSDYQLAPVVNTTNLSFNEILETRF